MNDNVWCLSHPSCVCYLSHPENASAPVMRHQYEHGFGPTQRTLVEMRKKAMAAEDVSEYPQDFKRHPKVSSAAGLAFR